MTATLQNRIADLETLVNPTNESLMVVFCEDGESHTDALQRAGHAPNTPTALCICYVEAVLRPGS
jgi:hypothetical protein